MSRPDEMSKILTFLIEYGYKSSALFLLRFLFDVYFAVASRLNSPLFFTARKKNIDSRGGLATG